MKFKLAFLVIYLALSHLGVIYSQQTVIITGNNSSGSGGSVSYSVGEINYTENSSATGSVIQGVQQPFEILVVNSIPGFEGMLLQCSAFPNPTRDNLNLVIENNQIENLLYQLYDINGKLIEIKKVDSNKTTISMQQLVSSTYFLKVLQGNTVVKTFKIIKN